MKRPLDGIQVLHLTWYQQGPYATVILSDLDADVLKVEAHGHGIGPNAAKQLRPSFVAHDRGVT